MAETPYDPAIRELAIEIGKAYASCTALPYPALPILRAALVPLLEAADKAARYCYTGHRGKEESCDNCTLRKLLEATWRRNTEI